jgi:transcription-repair coupling factor (superfamily II helicase)
MDLDGFGGSRALISLANALLNIPDFKQLINRINGGGCPVLFSGLGSIHKAHMISALRKLTGRPVLVVCGDELEAERMQSDIASLTGEDTLRLVAREFTFYNAESVSRQIEHERIKTLHMMASGQAGIVVATPDGIMQRTMPKSVLQEAGFVLKLGDRVPLDRVVDQLLLCGYKRTEQVEGIGQFAKRGGILDFFSPACPYPVRCEFFGDDVDSMGFFDIESQLRIENITSASILPAAESLASLYPGSVEGFIEELKELLLTLGRKKNTGKALLNNLESDIEYLSNRLSFSAADKYMNTLYRQLETGADYIQPEGIVVLCEPARLSERAKNYTWQLNQDIEALLENGSIEGSLAVFYRQWDECCELLRDNPVVMMDSFRGSSYPLAPRALLDITAKQLPSFGGSLDTAAGDIIHYLKDDYRIVVFCADKRKAGILKEHLESIGVPSSLDYSLTDLPEEGACLISVGAISAGMEYPALKLAVLTESYIPAPVSLKSVSRKRKSKNREKLQSYSDLSPGDYVVHEHHGIGRFLGIFKLPVDGVEKDYIKIAYSGTDSLYVPATQLDLVSKYIGGSEDHKVKLSKLGGTDWQKTKAKAKGAVKELAKELIRLYAERSRRPGYAFSPDTTWQREFEDSFEYTETEDQLRAVEEIKADMEKQVPMDRLLCGDVGYGKTEVAFRAIMKCVMDGKQAAILVPTTVLARQHYITAVKRFAKYPVKIDVLSRFRSNAQIRQALKNLKTGNTDIIIGTHRLIQKDVVFKDLGLLVVDEEQRFGVSHKERLKELARQVDVLTLSATPIPRTLNMALSGLRDMSSIEEPPSGRHPVQTYVLEHNWSVLHDAIRREISRGGQVYYLHNRVETIDRTAAKLSSLLGSSVSIAVAHGKMDEEHLNEVMDRMVAGEIQVLVCTTIIETGIDIPNVNTLIIEDADRLGLAQLHQLRGRVGRSPRHAFAYFTFRRGKILTEIASKRLSTIREFAEFNSGFKIAMRDLEIRGAGNLLGAEQSGHMLSVGYDMYLKLLEEAVLEEKGEKPKERTECSADLTVSANIPESYVESPELRMDLYRRIALIENEEDAEDMTDELIDRFGEPPTSVITLIHVALLRGEAAQAGIQEITQKTGRLYFKLRDFDMPRIAYLYNMPSFTGRIKVEAGTSPAISLKLKGPNTVDEAVKFVRAFKSTETIVSQEQ